MTVDDARETGVDPGLDRLVFYSDAVAAIAMTLLALDLPVPAGDTDAKLWRSFTGHLGHEYLNFLLSFVVIAAFWRAHHRFFAHVARIRFGLVGLNMLFLLTIVVVPFATRVLGETGRTGHARPTRFGPVFYAATIAAVGLSLLLMAVLAHRHGMLRPGTPPAVTGELTRGTAVPVAAFLASIPLAFVNVDLAKYSWLFLSVLAVFTLRTVRRIRG